jgi:hypothetical protein
MASLSAGRGYRTGMLNSKFADLKCQLMNIYHPLDPVVRACLPGYCVCVAWL